ncbi:MAG: glucans biosynthesis glucosyltransferase MdoH [Burkholderiales bacterium]|nr:glucans biosynthesis glucosyltransferase MdoH [Burkholderiales bacterium]
MDPLGNRLRAMLGRAGASSAVRIDARGHARLVTTPDLVRSPMGPRPWRGRGDADLAPPRATARTTWSRAANRRRFVLLGLVLGLTWLATVMMSAVLPYHGTRLLEIAILVLFAILFTWVALGFFTALAGFALLASGRDRYAISRTAAPDAPIADEARTAIVMPICNEHVPRVFAGLRATYESLARTGELARFDFFVLSDTNDPDHRVAEIAAWNDLCASVGGFGRIFYRWRRHRIKRKSGNIADFCRRWGRRYRYMVILDADSVMSGTCLATLVRLAEANPDAGIIQTAPRATGRETMYARMQQFATRMYGPLFTAGLHYWQLGESHYWGHNAIIRIAPFMRYCQLERLPGRGALSGEILSHDFVEAALMRRAGWGVWICYDLPGSYEEMPPNLLDELKRDRRWCQGNLMNARLMLTRGLHPAHRVVFMTGVMAYLSAPLWFAFLALSTIQLAFHTLVPPQYFTAPYQLFPLWPEWRPEWAIGLVTGTATLLFAPKLLSILLVRGASTARHGGRAALVASVLFEIVVSALLAPVRMLFHTKFVVMALLGWAVQWKSPPREDSHTGWGEALQRHGVHTVFGVAWASAVYLLEPGFLWWIAPVVFALIVSIPLSVYTSRTSLGLRLRRRGIFVIPEEAVPPVEIADTARYVREAPAPPGFTDAVRDPELNALVAGIGVARPVLPEGERERRERLVERVRNDGPQALTTAERTKLLSDPQAMTALHDLATARSTSGAIEPAA